jgi:hypothetical protein
MLWKYSGNYSTVAFDAGFPFMYADPEKALADLYDRVTGLVRYLRQSMEWAWDLNHEEAQRWEASLCRIIRAENGGTAPTPELPAMSPWGFGDYDSGG